MKKMSPNLSESDWKDLREEDETLVTPQDDTKIIKVLTERDGVPTNVHLIDGRVRHVLNIGWGYDMGDPFAHISTNVSPGVKDEKNFPFDFFFTYSVASISDPESGRVLFQVCPLQTDLRQKGSE